MQGPPGLLRQGRLPRGEFQEAELKARQRIGRGDVERPPHRLAALGIPAQARQHRAAQEMQPRVRGIFQAFHLVYILHQADVRGCLAHGALHFIVTFMADEQNGVPLLREADGFQMQQLG